MYIIVYIDAFEGGFLSALVAHDHYSVAVGCLWGCSQAENRANETGRSEVVAIDLPEGSIVDRKSRQFKKTPGASFSARHERIGKGRKVRESGNRHTLDSNKQLCCYEMFTTRLLSAASCAPGDGCLGRSFLYYQFYSTKGPADCRQHVFCGRK